VPRPLEPHQKKYMEFSFGAHHVHTPFILVFDPEARQMVKAIRFEFEYSDGVLKKVKHSVSVEV
jgi:hypothetical protein